MGLDITLGILVLIVAIRGWIRGFLLQAIQLAALIGAVYLADPLRDLALPFAREAIPSLRPELLVKLLWWAAAVVSYLVIGGIPASLVRMHRRRPMADLEPRWRDAGAGFLLGVVKGALYAAFLLWGLESGSARKYLQSNEMAQQQIAASRAVEFAHTYQPAEKVWASQPVQTYVGRIKSRGFWLDGATNPESKGDNEASPPLNARSTTGAVPASLPRPLDPNSPDFLDNVDSALRGVEDVNPR